MQKILKLGGAEARERASWVLSFMPPQHMNFFANLQYFALGTLDARGRPWASIVTGQRGFIRPVNQNYLAMVTDLSDGDPILETLEEGLTVEEGSRVVAGLGIDLTNRRRNKVAGRISRDMVRIDEKELQVIITADESLGNCPKVLARFCPS
jgi:predicted pyridoxine 5'-phosphate oxidase superfamily flavin-nucleotide-binding protein